MHKIGQSGGSLSRLLGPLLQTELPLVKDLLRALAKSALIPLALKAADQQKKSFGRLAGCFFCDSVTNFKWVNEWYHENS